MLLLIVLVLGDLPRFFSTAAWKNDDFAVTSFSEPVEPCSSQVESCSSLLQGHSQQRRGPVAVDGEALSPMPFVAGASSGGEAGPPALASATEAGCDVCIAAANEILGSECKDVGCVFRAFSDKRGAVPEVDVVKVDECAVLHGCDLKVATQEANSLGILGEAPHIGGLGGAWSAATARRRPTGSDLDAAAPGAGAFPPRVASWLQISTASAGVASVARRLQIARRALVAAAAHEPPLLIVGIVVVFVFVWVAAIYGSGVLNHKGEEEEEDEDSRPLARFAANFAAPGNVPQLLPRGAAAPEGKLTFTSDLGHLGIGGASDIGSSPGLGSALTLDSHLSAAATPLSARDPLCAELMVPEHRECRLLMPASVLDRWDGGKSSSFEVTDTQGVAVLRFSVSAAKGSESGPSAPRIVMTQPQVDAALAYCCARPGASGPFFVYRQARDLFGTCWGSSKEAASKSADVAHRFMLVDTSGNRLVYDVPTRKLGHLRVTDGSGALRAAVGPWEAQPGAGPPETLLIRVGPQADAGAVLCGLLCGMQLLRLEQPTAAVDFIHHLAENAEQPVLLS